MGPTCTFLAPKARLQRALRLRRRSYPSARAFICGSTKNGLRRIPLWYLQYPQVIISTFVETVSVLSGWRLGVIRRVLDLVRGKSQEHHPDDLDLLRHPLPAVLASTGLPPVSSEEADSLYLPNLKEPTPYAVPRDE